MLMLKNNVVTSPFEHTPSPQCHYQSPFQGTTSRPPSLSPVTSFLNDTLITFFMFRFFLQQEVIEIRHTFLYGLDRAIDLMKLNQICESITEQNQCEHVFALFRNWVSSRVFVKETLLNVTVSDWDNRLFDCIIQQISTFVVYFY